MEFIVACPVFVHLDLSHTSVVEGHIGGPKENRVCTLGIPGGSTPQCHFRLRAWLKVRRES